MAKKDIEIPFGAFDSELGGFEYTIPEGYKAEIKDGKVVVRKTEREDERIRKELIEYIKDQQYSFISAPDCRDKYEEEENDRYNSWIAWLEKQAEQKVAIDNTVWSKEDEEQFSFCCAAIELSNYSSDEHRNYAISFLESLKDRIQHQNRWKPSDEQMELIKDIVFKDRQKITRKELVIFHSIYNDLKKLREE